VISPHLSLEIAAVFHRGGQPLPPGAPVPGCDCPACTGVADDHPARIPAWRRRDPARAIRTDRVRLAEWERTVDRARSLTVLDVARLLGVPGCGDPVKRGRELAVRCPLHDDRSPSLRIAADGRRWFCDPCGIGGDPLDLFMRARRIDFGDAVRELASPTSIPTTPTAGAPS